MNGKLHAVIDYVRDHAFGISSVLAPVILPWVARKFFKGSLTKEIEMDIINKEVADGIFLSAQISNGELKLAASAKLAYLAQKIDDKSDNPIVSGVAQIVKMLVEKA